MIVIKYKGVEATCTTAEEAAELIKKLAELDYAPTARPQDQIVRPYITWTTNHDYEKYLKDYNIGINEAKSTLPDDYDNYLSKVNSLDNYKLPGDYVIEDFDTNSQKYRNSLHVEYLETPIINDEALMKLAKEISKKSNK